MGMVGGQSEVKGADDADFAQSLMLIPFAEGFQVDDASEAKWVTDIAKEKQLLTAVQRGKRGGLYRNDSCGNSLWF